MQLLSECVDDSTNEQGAEQPLRHCAKRVNSVTPCGKYDILPL